MTDNRYVYDVSVSEKSYDINGVKDSFNPFDNETEYREYSSDYRKIVPQIAIKDCEIPENPSDAEKGRIRHYFNMTGLFMLGQIAGVNILALALMSILMVILAGNTISPTAIEDYFMNSSLNMGITGLCYMLVNIAIYFIGCKVTDIDRSSLYKTQNLKFSTMMRYSVIAVFLQMFSALLANFAGTFIDSVFGTDIYSMLKDTPMSQSTEKLVVTVLYTCIIAPVTEELVVRGFVLKNASRVSQTFGIFVSAVVFGLMHGNIPQFILAFIVGIFLAYVTIKHNSIVPAIILHMIVNTTNMIMTLIMEYNADLGELIYSVWTVFFLVVGVVLFITSIALKWDRLPVVTKAQKKRNMPVLMTSWGMITMFAVHIFLMFFVYM